MSQPIRCQGGRLRRFIAPPLNNNMVEDVEYLFHIQLCHITFTGYREQIEMLKPIRGRGGNHFSHVQPEKHKLGRRCQLLAFIQVLSNPFKHFGEEVENVKS